MSEINIPTSEHHKQGPPTMTQPQWKTISQTRVNCLDRPQIDTTQSPKTLKKQVILDQLITLLFSGKSFTDACKELGVPRKTGYRYWNHWKQTEEPRLIDSEWWVLYKKLCTTNPGKALECLTRIKSRLMTTRIDIKETLKTDETINVNTTVDEDKVLSEAARILEGKTKPGSLH